MTPSRFKMMIILILICAAGIAFAEERQIPDVLVSFGDQNHKEYALVVEKESQQLFLYSCTGEFEEILRLNCSTGRVSGAKMIEGDNKTPEGIYFFTKIHENKELAPIYGIRAFVSDYPNFTDRTEGRGGSAIWLHGTNKILKDRDSSGCVALENENVQKLTQYITLNRTPLIIAQKLSYTPNDPALSESLNKFLSDWNTAIQSGSYHDYLSFYDDDYLPDMSWWMSWNNARKGSDVITAEIRRTGIFRHNNIYVALFDQALKTADREAVSGVRKLFISKQDDGFRIIGDEYQTTAVSGEYPLLAAAKNVKAKPAPIAAAASAPAVIADNDGIGQMIGQWLAAWSSKDIRKYGEFYADEFQSQGMNKSEWLKHKESLNKKYKYIRVSQQNLKIVRDDDAHRTVSFLQNYQSSGLKSSGMKELKLKLEGGQWKIFREKSGKM